MWCQVQATSAKIGQGCPLVRSKHAMCSGSDGQIYLYGGKSLLNQALRDLWRFDVLENRWEQIDIRLIDNDRINNNNNNNEDNRKCQSCRTSNWSNQNKHFQTLSRQKIFDLPPPLQEHTIVGYKNKLYIFGGEIGYSSDETPLWIFDLELFEWKKFNTNSPHQLMMNAISRPLGRRGHSAVIYQNIMCIYGGYQDIKGSTAEIWTFNLDTEEWYLEGNNPKKDASPSARHGHSAVVYKNSMYIYGGMSNLNVKGDFWNWNFKTKEWSRVKTYKNPGVLSFHSAIVVMDSMYIFGGERSNGHHTNELWRYRFINQTWDHIEIKGIAPSCRTRHVAVANPILNIEWQCQQTLNKMDKKKTKLHKRNRNKNKINDNFNGEVSHSSTDHIKSIVTNCFNQTPASKSSSIFSFNELETIPPIDPNATNSNTLQLNNNNNNNNTLVNYSSIQQQQQSQQSNMAEFNNENNNDLNNNLKNDETLVEPLTNISTTVRMRRRRPLLQKQRPYSDFYDTTKMAQNNDEFDFNELINESQFKRRSVQESMSYYSLCFSTPPAHIQRKHSPSITLLQSPVALEPPILQIQDLIGTSPKTDPANNNENIDNNQDKNGNQFVVKRRENFVSKRRLKKSDLGLLDFASLEIPSQSSNITGNNRYSALYSLTLDISPDFEKELKFSANSTPNSNRLNSVSTSDHYEYESVEMTHLDMLEDYLEPEEMLEIVTESASGQEISSSLNMKTIPKTPARKIYSNSGDSKISNKDKATKHQSSSASVSNSSSGYQSLSADSNGNSFDITSNPSISTSSSFGESQQQQQNQLKKDADFSKIAAQKLALTLNDSLNGNKAQSMELKTTNYHSKSETMKNKEDLRLLREIGVKNGRHLNRLSHWEPNIKEVIEEVPGGSPVLKHDTNSFHLLDVDDNFLISEDDIDDVNPISLSLLDESLALTAAYKDSIVDQRYPMFCMYVFGGKEDCITGVLNKQSMTIWKYYT